jgi:2-haloacid dehalogenase
MKAALFDVFGTVVDWRSGVARDVAAFLSRHGVEGIDAFAFADVWRRRYGPAMAEIRTGRRGFVRLDVLHRENLEASLGTFGLSPGAFPDAELEDLNRAWHRLDPWPDAVAGIARMKTGMIVAPLSNGNIGMMVNMARRAGLSWDAILGAEVARAYKPAPEVYLGAAETLGLDCADVLMVAAHNGDLAAARGCGMRTAFVLRPEEHGPGQVTDLAPEAEWDFVVSGMGELADRLGV